MDGGVGHPGGVGTIQCQVRDGGVCAHNLRKVAQLGEQVMSLHGVHSTNHVRRLGRFQNSSLLDV